LLGKGQIQRFCGDWLLPLLAGDDCILAAALAAIASTTATSAPPLVFIGGFIGRRISGRVVGNGRFVGLARFSGRLLLRPWLARWAWLTRRARLTCRSFQTNFLATFVFPLGFTAFRPGPPWLTLRFDLLGLVSLRLRIKALWTLTLAAFVAPVVIASAATAVVAAAFAARFAFGWKFFLDFDRCRCRRLAAAEPGENLAEQANLRRR
jgi:hypothetical protein